MRSLCSLSFVHLTFFEATVAFRRSFAAASCFRKLWHLFWCSLRPFGVIALNLSWQSLHRCINRMNKNNSEKAMAICSLGWPRGCFAIGKKITTDGENIDGLLNKPRSAPEQQQAPRAAIRVWGHLRSGNPFLGTWTTTVAKRSPSKTSEFKIEQHIRRVTS